MRKVAHWGKAAQAKGQRKQSDAECEETFDEIAPSHLDISPAKHREALHPGNSLPLPKKFSPFPPQRRCSAEITAFHCPSPLTPPPTCRLCLDCNPVDQLISPCLCRGSQGYVHLSCLQEWILRTAGPEVAYCELCMHAYRLKCMYKTQIRCCHRKQDGHIWQPVVLLVASAVLLGVLVLSWQEGFVEKPMLIAFGFVGGCSALLFFVLTLSRVMAVCLLRKVSLVPSPN